MSSVFSELAVRLQNQAVPEKNGGLSTKTTHFPQETAGGWALHLCRSRQSFDHGSRLLFESELAGDWGEHMVA